VSNKPLVSIVIPNFNYGLFLKDAITSALNQTYPNTEVIVVDDGSTDNSREVIAGYGSRIVPVLKRNGGRGSAIDEGFLASSGDIVCFLDSDDVWLPHKVERIVAVFEKYPEVGWVRHNLEMVDEHLRALEGGSVFAGSARLEHSSYLMPLDPYLYLERRSTMINSTGLALRREAVFDLFPMHDVLESYIGHRVQKLADHPDSYINIMLGAKGIQGYYVGEVLAYYRQHQLQEFNTPDDPAEMLRREIDVGELGSVVWSNEMGMKRQGTHVYKHYLVLDVLQGEPLWGLKRWITLARGLTGATKLAPKNSKLALRQSLALLFAFMAPHLWMKRWLGYKVSPEVSREGGANLGESS
jgi:glycosyltransferase involved in cell wall biosynthesis